MGQGLSNYQKKTGIGVDNHLEENLAKLSVGDDDQQMESDIPINKKTINKSIIKMDAIVEDAINSKKELLNLLSSQKEETPDTGSLTNYLNQFTNTDDVPKRRPNNDDDENQGTGTDDKNTPKDSTDDIVPELIPIQGQSSIYGTTRTDNLMQFGPPHTEPEPELIQIQGKSSIYGTTGNNLIQFGEKHHPDEIEFIPIEKKSSIYGTNQKNLSF